VGYLNADDKLDLAVANCNTGDVSVLLNTTAPETTGSVTQTASGGSTVTTDPDSVGATADVPVQTQVTLPNGLASTTVAITLGTTIGTAPPDSEFFGKQVARGGRSTLFASAVSSAQAGSVNSQISKGART
jgi:hypothetical protein